MAATHKYRGESESGEREKREKEVDGEEEGIQGKKRRN